jgi:hypothetical protein
MTGLWDQPGIPHRGWRCVDVYDIREDGQNAEDTEYATCEMCGKEQVRFVHIIEHDNVPERLNVGCICAMKLSGDYVNPERHESRLRRKALRKKNWLTRKWRTSAKGNEFLNVDGFNLVIIPSHYHAGMWKYKINDRFSSKSYASVDHAKMALFEDFWKTSQSEQ